MARKSRKNTNPEENTANAAYRAAVYIRLSVEDSQSGSASVETQQYIIGHFLDRHPEIEPFHTYIDNGLTGTNFNRPGFQSMLNDIESGAVNCVIVKDLSRLGRNSIDTGYYIEQYFPQRKVRFIAVNEGYDTAGEDGRPDMMIALRNMVNEAYAADISKKITAAQRQMMKDGKYVGALPPYGYLKDSEDCHKLVIDPEAAEVVRQIGERAEDNPDYPKLITDAVYEKCERLTEQYRDRVIFGGTGSREEVKFSPTILYPVGIDEEIVRHELFCPLLPVVPFKDDAVETVLDVIAGREHPLSMYVFTADKKWARRMMRTQQFGGGCINEVCIHMMVKGVPFNGTGHSGMGAYHGEWGFREFTHPQTVLTGRTRMNLPLREHPYSGKAGERKKKLLKWFER